MAHLLVLKQDISGNSDSFRFTYESTSGDVTVVVRVSSLDYRGKQYKSDVIQIKRDAHLRYLTRTLDKGWIDGS